MAVTKIDRAGRLTIPATMRRALGLNENSHLVIRVENGELRIHTREEALRRAQVHLRSLKKPGESVVDEFLAERREEARREVEEMDRWKRRPSPTRRKHPINVQ